MFQHDFETFLDSLVDIVFEKTPDKNNVVKIYANELPIEVWNSHTFSMAMNLGYYTECHQKILKKCQEFSEEAYFQTSLANTPVLIVKLYIHN